MRAFLLCTVLAVSATAAFAADATVTEFELTDLPLGQVTYPSGKTLTLVRGIGSAAYRDLNDPAGVVWTLTDRGPNLDCEGIEELTGIGIDKLCAGDDKAKNFPMPDFRITIQKVKIDANGTAKVTETIALKDKTGKPVGGLPFAADGIKMETAYDMNGRQLTGTNGLDSEALVRLPGGGFPLANPDGDAYKKSANARLWKIDRATGKVMGQHLYVMDDAASFAADNKKEPQKQNAVRMSEMVAFGPDRLLVDERISKTTKFYMIDLTDATPLDPSFDDAKTAPSLEQMGAADLAAKGIKPVAKTLVLNTDDVAGLPKKIEGVAVMSPTEMIVFNDSDFGIEGDANKALRVTFKEPMLK